MKSPFPGMDPYLERNWRDVHHRLCTYGCDQIQEQLGEGLLARVDERLVVESEVGGRRSIYPNVRVVEEGREVTKRVGPGGVAVAEPIVVRVDSEPARQAFIEIIEADGGRLVTAIEFISPSNKLPGDGRRQYRRKQRELYRARVNVMEIDLTRKGRRRILAPDAAIPTEARATYQACVFRGHRPDAFELYPMPLRAPLRAILVPLRKGEGDVVLELQALVEEVYRKGRYERTDYSRTCEPALSEEDRVWAAGLVG
jgi:hypothetical protein